MMPELQIVYVLTNPAMPNLVKIGWTCGYDANARIGQLYSTGVPVPFKLEFACKVADGLAVEKALHIAFAPSRVNAKREFFSIEPEQAIAILRLLHTVDATSEVAAQPAGVDEQSVAAGEQLRARRPRLNFMEMGIPVGSELKSVQSEQVVTVVDPRRVRLGDDEISLSAATKQVLQIGYNVNPGPHWTFNGRVIRDIYEETYGARESGET